MKRDESHCYGIVNIRRCLAIFNPSLPPSLSIPLSLSLSEDIAKTFRSCFFFPFIGEARDNYHDVNIKKWGYAFTAAVRPTDVFLFEMDKAILSVIINEGKLETASLLEEQATRLDEMRLSNFWVRRAGPGLPTNYTSQNEKPPIMMVAITDPLTETPKTPKNLKH